MLAAVTRRHTVCVEAVEKSRLWTNPDFSLDRETEADRTGKGFLYKLR